MSDIKNLSDTIIPKSDQLNAEQLMGGPITITVTSVRRGESDQPVVIGYEGDSGRPYKPCKTMRKVLIFAWGEDGGKWVGRQMQLFCDHSVMFGGVKVGGIRISHMSDIDRDISVALTATKGKKAQVTIKKMDRALSPVAEAEKLVRAAANSGTAALGDAWKKIGADARKALGQAFIDAQKKVAAEIDAAAAPVATTEDPAESTEDDDSIL